MSARKPSIFTVLVGVAMACGLAIAVVFQTSAGQIEQNRTRMLEQAVTRVLPGIVSTRGFITRGDALEPAPVEQATFIAGYDGDGALLGVALPARVMGYQDSIRMLFGYDPTAQRLTGFVVLESRETPGLGARIGTDPAFLASLSGLDVTLTGGTLANTVTLAARGAERKDWQLDGITGATISSQAVARAANDIAADLVAIRSHLQGLADG